MSMDLNKTIAEASLDNLHDIIVPEAITFFPLTPGWVMVFWLLLSLFFHFGYKQYRQYQANTYRRDAAHELATLKSESKGHAIALLSLAKRVGISAYGRDKIATLNEDAWWDFMQTHSTVEIRSDFRREIQNLLYKNDTVFSKSNFDALFSLVKGWIKTHKVAKDV